jgi:Flp pilus assembly protein TadG
MVSSRAKIAGFATDRNGGVAVIFGLALLPLVAGVGAAVDYSRAN